MTQGLLFFLLFVFALVGGAVTWQRFAMSRAVRDHPHMFEGPDVAFISETEVGTNAGNAALCLLVVLNVGAVAFVCADLSRSLTLQYVPLAIMWLAINQVLTVLVLVGRGREFIIRKRED